MKNNLLKYYIAAFYLCSTFAMFAQPGDSSNDGGIDDSGASDTTPVPIDDYVWILALIGLILVFVKFKSIQNKKINS